MPHYPSLPYSSENIKLRNSEGTDEIWDFVRKKWLVLTPEEWVRQHYIHFLISTKGYAESSIAIEKKVEVNGLPQRFDALVYQKGNPLILIECKAPEVKLTEDVFHQACRYNTYLKARLIVLTNGHQTIVALMEGDRPQFIRDIPQRSEWK